MQKFLIYAEYTEELSTIIEAPNEEIAKYFWYKNIRPDKGFIDYCYEKCINSGFSDQFWHKILPSCEEINENGKEFLDNSIEKNTPRFYKEIKNYFNNKQFSDLYINYWNSDDEYPKHDYFPHEMIDFIWRKTLEEDDYIDIKIINLSNLCHLKYSD